MVGNELGVSQRKGSPHNLSLRKAVHLTRTCRSPQALRVPVRVLQGAAPEARRTQEHKQAEGDLQPEDLRICASGSGDRNDCAEIPQIIPSDNLEVPVIRRRARPAGTLHPLPLQARGTALLHR